MTPGMLALPRLGRTANAQGRTFALRLGVLALLALTWPAMAAETPPRKIPDFEVDLAALNQLFPGRDTAADGSTNGFPFQLARLDEAFTLQLQLGAKVYNVGSHLFGGKVIPIPYGDGESVNDAAGNPHRGDAAAAEFFPPGSVGFAIKHHRPMQRVLRMEMQADTNLLSSDLANKALATPEPGGHEPDFGLAKEEIKLQDTHIEIVVGVLRDGQPGVITVNNPQDYQEGGFGDEETPGDYPMVFTKPVLPAYVPEKVRPLFIENIRTMAVGFNTISKFPANYDGGDPLAAHAPEKIRECVKMMVKAVAGDEEAQDYFKRPENYMYCAELAFVSTTAGLLVPLNQKSMEQLGVSAEEWQKFKAEVAKHNLHDPEQRSFFVRNNRNFNLHLIQLADLRQLDELKPLAEYAPESKREAEAEKLAFQPMTMADIIESFMRLNFPRQEMGEDLAPYQARALVMMKPGLLQMMALDPASPQARAVSGLYDQVVAAVEKKYPSYDAFRAALAPLMQRARGIAGPVGTGQGLFTPPSLFHVVLKGLHTEGGLITLQYVGHGIHYSAVRPK